MVPGPHTNRDLPGQLDQQYTGWVLDQHIPGKLVSKKTIDSYCPRHFIIGEENGYVVVFKPEPVTGNLQVLQTTKVKADTLTEGMELELMDGISIDTAEDVELFIENLGS